MEVNLGTIVLREVDINRVEGDFMMPKTHDGQTRTAEVVGVYTGSLFSIGDIVLHEKDIMFMDAGIDFGGGSFYVEEDYVCGRVVDGDVISIRDFVYLRVDDGDRLDIGGVRMDNSFNKFRDDLVTQSGEVVSLPLSVKDSYSDDDKYLAIDLCVGDIVYGHHFMVHEDNIRNIGGEEFSEIRYEELYAGVRDGNLFMLGDWNFLEIMDISEEKIGSFVVSESGKNTKRGVVRYLSRSLVDVGIVEGDEISFKRNRDYRVNVDGVYYYRVATRDIICKH